MINCDNCGRPVPPEYTAVELPQKITLCANCYNAYQHCNSCVQANACPLQEYQGPDKIIQKQIQTPQGIIVATVPNPAIIEKTCRTNCLCFHEDFCYKQQVGLCDNYKTIMKVMNLGESQT